MDIDKLHLMVKDYDQTSLESQKIWEEIQKFKPEEMHYLDFQNLIMKVRLNNQLINSFINNQALDCKSKIYSGASKEYLYDYVSNINKNSLTDTQKKLLDDLHNISKQKYFPYTYDREICDVRIISNEEFDRLINKLNNHEEFSSEEKDSFLLMDDTEDSFIAIDNNTGNMWTEEFKEKEYAIRYLQGEGIDKLRDEECKYEICIYETEQDYNKGEPFQLDVYSDLEDAKAELKRTINFNSYFSGNIINQENGIEEFSYYLNKENERYSYIFECTLESSSKAYEHQFLLVKDPNDLETNFEIDLTGRFDFNCDYNVINPKLVQIVNSKNELQEFCEKHNINIPDECIRKDGLIANGLLINDNLEAIDWLENLEEEEI